MGPECIILAAFQLGTGERRLLNVAKRIRIRGNARHSCIDYLLPNRYGLSLPQYIICDKDVTIFIGVSVSATIGQFTRLLRSLELRAVSHCTVLLLWDQKLLFRMRDCFEGSIIHLPTV